MSMNNDDDWVAGLAGQPHRDSRDAREGAQLRRALLALPPREAEGAEAPAASVAREAQLLRRAGVAGLRVSGTPAWRRLGWIAVAASVALVGVGINWWPRAPDATITVRSAADPIVRRAAVDPLRAQRQLLEQLAAVGISARGYEMLGRYGIDADLPRPLTAGQRALLAQYGFDVPVDQVLRVEFVSSDPP